MLFKKFQKWTVIILKYIIFNIYFTLFYINQVKNKIILLINNDMANRTFLPIVSS